MILVTVGSAYTTCRFERLIEKMDEIAGKISEPVLIQYGSTLSEPRIAKSFKFTTYNEMQKHYQQARFVVGHCGSGTVLNAMRLGVPLIAVPRDLSRGELDFDDHQLALARKIEGHPGVQVVYDIQDLEPAVTAWLENPPEKKAYMESKNYLSLISALKTFVNQAAQAKGKS